MTEVIKKSMTKKLRKSIAIIGEGITEWYYFDYIRKELPSPIKISPDLPSGGSDYKKIFKKAKTLASSYDKVYCLIDYDQILKQRLQNTFLNECNSLKKNIMVIITNPCSEYWFLLHFLKNYSSRVYSCYDDVLPALRKFLPDYDKTKNYFSQKHPFKTLETKGSRSKAIEYAKKLEQHRNNLGLTTAPRSDIYQIFEFIKNPESNNNSENVTHS